MANRCTCNLLTRPLQAHVPQPCQYLAVESRPWYDRWLSMVQHHSTPWMVDRRPTLYESLPIRPPHGSGETAMPRRRLWMRIGSPMAVVRTFECYPLALGPRIPVHQHARTPGGPLPKRKSCGNGANWLLSRLCLLNQISDRANLLGRLGPRREHPAAIQRHRRSSR